VGRYALYDEIASGGMAAVHVGRLIGPVGFSRTVAIKRLHSQLAKDHEFVSMLLDEAKLAARIVHPNVVSILDVVEADGALFLVMDYVHGETLSRLIAAAVAQGRRVPLGVAVDVLVGVLYGLHAAHEARSERGVPLGIVHRDVSPQNIMVGVDGAARVLDFGIALATERLQTTRHGLLKGKSAYLAPEQLRGDRTDRRTDIYAASVVLWEALTGRRLHDVSSGVANVYREILFGSVRSPRAEEPDVPVDLDAIVSRGLSPEPADRFPTAREMAAALEKTAVRSTPAQVGEWVEAMAGEPLRGRADRIAEIESATHPMLEPLPRALAIASRGGRGAETTSPAALETPSDPDDAAQPRATPPTTPSAPVPSRGSVTVALPGPGRRSRSRAARRLGLGLLLSAAAGASVLMFGSRVWRDRAARPPLAPSGTPSAASEAASIPAVSGPAHSVPAPASADIEVAAVDPARDAGGAADAGRALPGVRTKSTAAAGDSRRKGPDCDPPYTIDARGLHVPKPECI
jgi:serine/threonine-protein kinase